MKRILFILMVILSLVLVTGCDNNTDAKRFKKEYESLNGVVNDNGKTIRTITIDKNNPFIYKTEDDIVNLMNNKESFLVYFGFPECPWCRSMLESLINSAKDNDLETIYYVDVLDIRDIIDENGDKTKEGTEGYYKLLDLMNEVLDNYEVKDSDGNIINTNEKRIYAPNVVAVIDGEAKNMVTGISDKQDDAYMELNDDIKYEMYISLNAVVTMVQEKLTTCDKGC